MMTKHYPPQGFSKRLHYAFLKSGKNLTEISKETGISRSSIYSYIYDAVPPNISSFAKLCKALNVSSDWLLFEGKEDRMTKTE